MISIPRLGRITADVAGAIHIELSTWSAIGAISAIVVFALLGLRVRQYILHRLSRWPLWTGQNALSSQRTPVEPLHTAKRPPSLREATQQPPRLPKNER